MWSVQSVWCCCALLVALGCAGDGVAEPSDAIVLPSGLHPSGVVLDEVGPSLYPDFAAAGRLRVRRAELAVVSAANEGAVALGQAFGELGVVLHGYGAAQAALAAYGNAERLSATGGPEAVASLRRWTALRGHLLAEQHRTPEAVEVLRRALSLSGEPGDARSGGQAAQTAEIARWQAVGDLSFDLGEIEQARQAYEEVLARRSSVCAARFGLGQIAQMEAEHERALALFDQALRDDPRCTVVHFARATSLRALGRADEALAALELRGDGRWVPSDPVLAEVLAVRPEEIGRRARRAFESGDLEAARAGLVRAVSARPEDPLLRQNLAAVLTRSGELELALEQYQKAAELGADEAQFHLNRGLTLYRTGRVLPALQSLRQGLARDPAHLALAAGFARHALLLRSQRESAQTKDLLVEGLAYVDRALAYQPGDATLLWERVRLLGALGRTEEARASARDLLRHVPDHPQALEVLANG